MSAIAVEYEPRLLEEVVLRCVAQAGVESELRLQRDPLYSIEEPGQREAAFNRLHAQWFARLRIDRPLQQALAEFEFAGEIDRCLVVAARSREDEAVELFVASRDQLEQARPARSLVIRLRAVSFIDPTDLLAFLRGELLHVADMLDPNFGYQPALPPGEPAQARLLLDRYRVLWDATVAGRLARRGQMPVELRERRWAEFVRTFPMLADGAAEVFARFFDHGPHTHAELFAFAREPVAKGGRKLRMRCPLCGCLIARSTDEAEPPPAPVQARIRRDFPAWQPEQGLCRQCAELYRARETLSAASHGSPAV